jgi:hypothetical protein
VNAVIGRSCTVSSYKSIIQSLCHECEKCIANKQTESSLYLKLPRVGNERLHSVEFKNEFDRPRAFR